MIDFHLQATLKILQRLDFFLTIFLRRTQNTSLSIVIICGRTRISRHLMKTQHESVHDL